MNTTEIWSAFKDELLGFIRSRVSSSEVAEDILQEVFIKVHQHQGQLQDNMKLTSWIYQITRNTIIDYYRKKKIKTSDELSELETSLEEDEPLNPQFLKCLMPFVQKLPEIYKDALEKTMSGTFSQKEYAEQLGISYSALKSRVQRGRQMLKDNFVQCCNIQTDTYGNIISSNIDNCNC